MSAKMKVIALGQMKGGCSKSSTAINLACVASADHKTALIDMDIEQGTSWKWGKKRLDYAPHVDKCEAVNLKNKLTALEQDGFEWVFLDLPGRSAPTSSAGLMASDFILVPCRPVDTDVEPSFHTVKSAIRADKKYAYLMSIAPHQHDKHRARKVAEVLRAASYIVSPVIIVQRMEVPDAIAAGQCISEYKPNSEAIAEFADLFKWLKGQMK